MPQASPPTKTTKTKTSQNTSSTRISLGSGAGRAGSPTEASSEAPVCTASEAVDTGSMGEAEMGLSRPRSDDLQGKHPTQRPSPREPHVPRGLDASGTDRELENEVIRFAAGPSSTNLSLVVFGMHGSPSIPLDR